jgi:putative tryptophan/tyrosine transport system substrate-binding protein
MGPGQATRKRPRRRLEIQNNSGLPQGPASGLVVGLVVRRTDYEGGALVSGIRRREFIIWLGSAAGWSLAARAQQPAQVKRVGMLMGFANDALGQVSVKAFQQELERLGWAEGRSVAFEFRWAEGRSERFADFAAEFVRLRVDVILTTATPSTAAAMQATSKIPIVFVGSGDPVGSGLVTSLARPGGNVTGLSNQNLDVASKRVTLLREIVPGLRRLGVMHNPGNPVLILEMREVREAAHTMGLDVIPLEIRHAEDIAPAFEALQGPALSLYVSGDPLVNSNALRINTLALIRRLPTMHAERAQLETGGLISYGVNRADLYRRGADYVDKILRGAKPGDIPVQQPTKFDLVINLITAKALGLTVPPTLLATADEVIE